jgi:hypothetical protein
LVSLLKTLLRITTRAGVASRSVALELPLLGVHLLALIVDYNSTIHKFLKAGVDIGHQLATGDHHTTPLESDVACQNLLPPHQEHNVTIEQTCHDILPRT